MLERESSTQLLKRIGKEKVFDALKSMLLIRQFELRGESAYQHGLVGGFYHAYSGQEAIQTAAIQVFGKKNWWIGFYRCHALALLLGISPREIMAELYGRSTGNAKGRGGSMHLYAERLLGGFAIVGGHLPIATGAAFTIKYLKQKDEIAICFLGEGAVAQGAFHESLNLAALWNLPVLFIIENNQWGMGTHVSRALAMPEKIAETFAKSYQISGYTLNGMDYLDCYAGFEKIQQEIKEKRRPILVECICERLRGHSISDPATYRTKEQLQEVFSRDPIPSLRQLLEQEKMIDPEGFKKLEKEAKEQVLDAMKYAEESPWPALTSLEEDVYAP